MTQHDSSGTEHDAQQWPAGFDDPDEPAEGHQPTADDYAELVPALQTLIDWIIGPIAHVRDLRAIGKRAVAMAWVIDPDRFKDDGPDGSLRELSRRLNFDAAAISPVSADFSRRFGIHNKFQKHDWRKKA